MTVNAHKPLTTIDSERSQSLLRGFKWPFALVLMSVFLSAFTVYDQVFNRVGLQYIWDEQLRFHRWIIEGTSIDPWQYRILASYCIEATHGLIKSLNLTPSYGKIFAALRFMQNTFIFIASGVYFRKLKLTRLGTILALAILAWGFTYSGYSSGLAFDTYFDILFYLLAAICVMSNRPMWIIPISILAALNRETGILIPLIPLVSTVRIRHRVYPSRRVAIISGVGLLAFLVILVGVRAWFGSRPFSHTFIPGFSLLKYNITNFFTYYSGFATFLTVPIVAILQWRDWPSILHRYFWFLIPIWVLIHSFTSHMAEARLFLVPYVLVILPAAFLSLGKETSSG